ncbi:hypothetical protein [Pedobacter sp. MR2016-24]|uniref:hypothetical protein n=1 Tax=Pedobacter sp. MR2016-24 TaxID=2994466 RepID=UPI00224758F1|nr:hypothetical protein [Pedobacter sp. MR2016-24]MCX2486612.1 hypothetical protein [Pedobacter sp. MR2016-24]
MELLHPIPYQLSTEKKWLHYFPYCNVPSIYTDIQLTKNMNVLVEMDENGKEVGRMVVAEDWNNYFAIQGLMNHCINNAEILYVRLRDYLKTLNDDEIATLFESLKIEGGKEILTKLDFSKLRGVFSPHVKKRKDIPEYDTIEKIKEITKLFADFITDRNIYVHGRLILVLMENKLIIEHISQGVEVYSEINIDILKSNNAAYLKLSSFMDRVSGIDKYPVKLF